MEAVLFRRPAVHARFATRAQDVDAVAPWALNQGFYNLFLAVVAAVGAVLALAGADGSTGRTVGLALVLAGCGSMLAASLVLLATDRRMARAAAMQGTVPLVAVVAAVLALTS
ncbi:hypothetical protein CCO02nite_21470 [Cellulomonas composti]|uniref:Epimerase n=2 Tax=Cellulomonas composti TaxID=266130 RepID=A0A511JCJ6_9CELL|nr:hypothetical protein CCO02nite_21470 [Cellulomonas composti]